jgi:hypothetical protein
MLQCAVIGKFKTYFSASYPIKLNADILQNLNNIINYLNLKYIVALVKLLYNTII